MQDGAGISYRFWLGDPDGGKFHVLHPFATGYSKMTAVWLSAFDNLCNMVYLAEVQSS
jgi:hypothetical protein